MLRTLRPCSQRRSRHRHQQYEPGRAADFARMRCVDRCKHSNTKTKRFKFIFLLVKLRLVSAGPLGVKVDQPVDADCTVSWGTRQRKLIKLQTHIMLSETIVRAIWLADAARHAASRPGMQIYPQASRCLGLCWFPSSSPHFIVEAACSLLFCA